MSFNFMEKKQMTLWMGDLDDSMDETSIATSFLAVGESVASVKVIKNRATGQSAGYCFVEFPSQEASQRALLRLNGKPIPNSDPPRRFKLNTASKNRDLGEEYSIFVGDLSEDVDDFMLYEVFHKRYPSTRGAKVVLGQGGISRGFGFVRFGEQREQLSALREMQNWVGIGSRPIRVSGATPRKQWEQQKDSWNDQSASSVGGSSSTVPSGQSDWSSQPDGDASSWQQWQQYYQQQQYWQYQQYSNQWGDYWQAYQNQGSEAAADDADSPAAPPPPQPSKSDDPNADFDVESANAELIARSDDFLETLDNSRWFGDVPNFPVVAS